MDEVLDKIEGSLHPSGEARDLMKILREYVLESAGIIFIGIPYIYICQYRLAHISWPICYFK